jgi:hypothetical protein
MEEGAYVHYAWWNNLCKEYMGGPLHQSDSDPGTPLDLENPDPDTIIGLLNPDWGDKAIPEDDYQFQADAERFLQAIREHNPNAIIILVGHSMGGAAVGDEWYGYYKVPIPHDLDSWWATFTSCGYFYDADYYGLFGPPFVFWYPYVDSPPRRVFDNNVINLFHRYQKEYLFPFDYLSDEHFIHNPPMNGTSSQEKVSTCEFGINAAGLCVGFDGHGEIVGFHGVLLPN